MVCSGHHTITSDGKWHLAKAIDLWKRGKSSFQDWDLMIYVIAPRERGSAGLLLKVFGSMRYFPSPAGGTGEGLQFAKLALVSGFMEGSACKGPPIAVSTLGKTSAVTVVPIGQWKEWSQAADEEVL